MKRIATISLIATVLCSVLAAAQAPTPRKPGPEEKNLAYFIGTWKLEGDMKPGTMGPGGRFTGSERIEWLPGGFYLVSHSQGSSPMGKEVTLAVMGYDPQKKTYTYDAYNNMGEAEHATGSFDGKAWTWTSDMNMGGKTMKGHFILTQVSPAAYTFKFETSEDGSNWATVMEGTGNKSAGAVPASRKK
jgi:hypothetical protein